MLARVAPDNVATPDPLVVAGPTELPFSVNAMLFPPTPEPPAVSVALKLAVPP